MEYHIPVLLSESIQSLNISPNGTYVDCTLGEGGHSMEILKKVGDDGKLFSFDHDKEAIEYVRKNFKKLDNWVIINANFSKISNYVSNCDGILMDLGMSSRQLEKVGRGISYNRPEEELDMRMDETLGVTAKDLLKVLPEKELANLFFKYGEERYSRRIAREIKKNGNINTVGDLTSLIYKVVPAAQSRGDSHHPARRVFQALRIAVNDELNSLEKGLDEGFKILNSKGRFVIITFHSLEDRIVKKFFEEKVKNNSAKYIHTLLLPSEEEIAKNPRAHSSKLRCIEKI